MNPEQLIKIMTEARWVNLGKQLSPSLMSFTRNYERCNIYITTGTVTLQDTRKKFDKGTIWKNVDLEVLAQIMR